MASYLPTHTHSCTWSAELELLLWLMMAIANFRFTILRIRNKNVISWSLNGHGSALLMHFECTTSPWPGLALPVDTLTGLYILWYHQLQQQRTNKVASNFTTTTTPSLLLPCNYFFNHRHHEMCTLCDGDLHYHCTVYTKATILLLLWTLRATRNCPNKISCWVGECHLSTPPADWDLFLLLHCQPKNFLHPSPDWPCDHIYSKEQFHGPIGPINGLTFPGRLDCGNKHGHRQRYGPTNCGTEQNTRRRQR